MILGGVLLAAGMELAVANDDHLNGGGPLHFLLQRIVEVQGNEWVVLDGQERPTPTTPWRTCRAVVRISALKRSLTLI